MELYLRAFVIIVYKNSRRVLLYICYVFHVFGTEFGAFRSTLTVVHNCTTAQSDILIIILIVPIIDEILPTVIIM